MDRLIIDNYVPVRAMRIIDPAVIDHFKKASFEKRQLVSRQMRLKYPDRVPVIVGRGEIKRTPAINKYKFLVPIDCTFGNFTAELRKHINNLDDSTALFFFITDKLPPPSYNMHFLYETYKNEDGFLYITYMCENTFGCFQ